MAYWFEKGVNPKKPLDLSDPPPSGWETVDAHDYRKALFGFAPETLKQCAKWEKRELARRKKLNLKKKSGIKKARSK